MHHACLVAFIAERILSAQAVISWKLKDEFGSNPDELHKAIKEALGTRRGDGMKWCAGLL